MPPPLLPRSLVTEGWCMVSAWALQVLADSPWNLLSSWPAAAARNRCLRPRPRILVPERFLFLNAACCRAAGWDRECQRDADWLKAMNVENGQQVGGMEARAEWIGRTAACWLGILICTFPRRTAAAATWPAGVRAAHGSPRSVSCQPLSSSLSATFRPPVQPFYYCLPDETDTERLFGGVRITKYVAQENMEVRKRTWR